MPFDSDDIADDYADETAGDKASLFCFDPPIEVKTKRAACPVCGSWEEAAIGGGMMRHGGPPEKALSDEDASFGYVREMADDRSKSNADGTCKGTGSNPRLSVV